MGGVEYANTPGGTVAHPETALIDIIPNAEGFAKRETSGSYSDNFILRDHLGNTRVVFKDANNDGVIDATDIVQVNAYYPFGLNHGANINGAAGAFKYQYNGKELNEDFGLNWNDYGARFYDPAIGRWHATDPLAEMNTSWSPYVYVRNNPVGLIDPDGMKEGDPIDGGTLSTVTCTATRLPKYNGMSTMQLYVPTSTPKLGNGSGATNTPILPPIPISQLGLDRYIPVYGSGLDSRDAFNTGHPWQGTFYGVLAITDVFLVKSVLVNLGKAGIKAIAKKGVQKMVVESQVEVLAKAGVEVAEAESELAIKSGTGAYYSVAFEMELTSDLYPNVYRGAHFKAANEALELALSSDIGLSTSISRLGIAIPKFETGSILGKSPLNWVWHHDAKAGIMQLVPKYQHTINSKFWETLHPNGIGGFSIWGK